MKWTARGAMAAGLTAIILCWLGNVAGLWIALAPYDTSKLARPEASVRIYDRDGQLLRESVGSSGQRSMWTSLDELGPDVVSATIAVEDHRFREHDGVDLASVGRAVLDNLRHRRIVSGASTLTMQLVSLIEPHPRTLVGKAREAATARRLERALGKQEILEQYLNRAPYGANTIGAEAAAHRYFGKPTALLSLAESALIAGLPKAPSLLNPFRDPAAAKQRQLHVLARMRETGLASPEAVSQAMREPLHYEDPAIAWRAEHFTDFVLASRPATGAGGAIETTLDRNIQTETERAVKEHVAALADTGATNAAVVILDNRRCEILAMVGSADYGAADAGMVNGALALRQPGSTLKPFTYALAFARGATPATVIADVATHYGTATGPMFSPQNFSQQFSGPVMIGSALGRSLNIPAMRVAAEVGTVDLIELLRSAGLTSLREDAAHYGLGLTLGNGEVTLLELAQAYAMLARRGVGCTATALAGQRDGADGGAASRQVLSEEVAYLTTDVLSNESHRIAAFGPSNALLLGFPVAVKTGTSSNWRDNWAIGYTSDLTVAVWTGNFSGRSMNQLTGASGAGPLFNRVMSAATSRGKSVPQLAARPPGIVEVSVCALSGLLAHDDCPRRVAVRMPERSIPTEPCGWHQRVAIDMRNGFRAGERCPAEHLEHRVFESLPAEYAAWVASRGHTEQPPTRFSPLCPRRGPVAGVVAIRYPRDGERFVIEPGYAAETQSLELAADLALDAGPIEWTVDGAVIARSEWPFAASWQLAPGTHQIGARAVGQRGDVVTIEVR